MSDVYEPDDDLGLEWRDDDTCEGDEPEATEYDAPLGDPCPHCQSTLTDDVATIWQDGDLICLAHQCFWCGKTFETVKPFVVEPEPIEDDDIPF